MEQYLSIYQNWLGLFDPKFQLIISGLILLVLGIIFIKFFIKNVILIIVFLLLAPLYWPILKNFLSNITTVF